MTSSSFWRVTGGGFLMRKLLAFVLCVSFAVSAQAGITFNTLQTYFVNGQYVGASYPFTVGTWVNPSNFTGTNVIFLSGRNGSGGWDLAFCGSTCGCGANSDLHFTKLSVVDICSTISISTGAWTFVGAVVSSTQVHFFTMTGSGTVTTQNVSNSSAIATPTSPITEISENSSDAMRGTIAQMMVWMGSSLSDQELAAAAYGGPQAIGRVVTLYYPMFALNSTFGLGNMAGNPAYLLGQVGTPSTGPHCPCGNPFGGN